jgi:hypothetical protein
MYVAPHRRCDRPPETEHAALYFRILASADRFASQSNSDLKNSLDQVNKAAAL